MQATVSFVAPSTDTTVTSRPVGVVINGGSETVLDCISPQTFAVSPNDSIIATPKGDINPLGQGPAGNPLSVTAPAGTVPPVPGDLQIAFGP